MTNRWLQLLEAHVEKGVLLLAGAFFVAMLAMYLIRSPNKVPYGGEELGPRALLEKVKQDADGLESRIRSATADDPQVEEFSEELKKQHASGIFVSASKAEPASTELRLAAVFGQKIEVPGLKESDTPAGSITLVSPLKPSEPKTRTGRSLAIRDELRIAAVEEPSSTTPPEESVEAEEVAWVTVAAYFNKKAQYNEMIKAGYAPFRSKAYVMGVDVERQEALSTGEFSEWQPVTTTKAMPKLELREPVFDDQTEQLMNKDDVRQTFGTIKQAQPILMQAPFYAVEGGDFWEVPPLEGHEDDEEDVEEDEDELELAGGRTGGRYVPPEARGGGRTFEGPPPSTGGRGRSGGGRSSGGGRGMGGSGRSAGGYDPSVAARSDTDQRIQARKEIREALREARKQLGQKDYQLARQEAERVMGNQYATKGNVRDAKNIVKLANRWLELEAERAAGRGRTVSGRGRDLEELITHPETGEPALWFHDDTVEDGKTYRYRMRVKLWNRYVGRMRSMKNPEDAKKTVVAGEWSFPSEPVTVTPSTYFFFTGSRPPDTASAEVWRWRKGRWFKQRFDVSVGDVIGGDVKNVKTGEYDEEGNEVKTDIDFTTGAVVLDLRFNEPVAERRRAKDEVFSYGDKTSAVMVYLDPADGQVKEKVAIFDRRNPKKKELEDKAW